jgi:hypothetical protein
MMRERRARGGFARESLVLIGINVFGGIAVLGSYASGLMTHPELGGSLWGDVPSWLRPWYSVSMLLATAGYFAFTHFTVFCLDPSGARIGDSLGYRALQWIYAGILAPSALWMPLTFAMLEQPSALLWVAIRVVLAITGASSIALVAALAAIQPRSPRWAHRLAVAGTVAFAVQTALLDALVWPAYFPFHG